MYKLTFSIKYSMIFFVFIFFLPSKSLSVTAEIDLEYINNTSNKTPYLKYSNCVPTKLQNNVGCGNKLSPNPTNNKVVGPIYPGTAYNGVAKTKTLNNGGWEIEYNQYITSGILIYKIDDNIGLYMEWYKLVGNDEVNILQNYSAICLYNLSSFNVKSKDSRPCNKNSQPSFTQQLGDYEIIVTTEFTKKDEQNGKKIRVNLKNYIDCNKADIWTQTTVLESNVTRKAKELFTNIDGCLYYAYCPQGTFCNKTASGDLPRITYLPIGPSSSLYRTVDGIYKQSSIVGGIIRSNSGIPFSARPQISGYNEPKRSPSLEVGKVVNARILFDYMTEVSTNYCAWEKSRKGKDYKCMISTYPFKQNREAYQLYNMDKSELDNYQCYIKYLNYPDIGQNVCVKK